MTTGEYKVQSKLGSGGLGTTYLSTTGEALKLLDANITESAPTEKVRELIAQLSQVSSPQILKAKKLLELGGRKVLVSDYIESSDVGAAALQAPVPPRATLEVAAAVGRALVDGGSAGLRHGDLKPASIVITRTGEVHVCDFGVSSLVEVDEVNTDLTMFYSSLSYMPPEDLDGISSATQDVYSLGVIIYQMITCTQPPKVSGNRERYEEQRNLRIVHLAGELDEQSAGIAGLVRDATAFDPEQRPTPAEFVQRCEMMLESVSGESLAEWAPRVVGELLEVRESYPLRPDDVLSNLLAGKKARTLPPNVEPERPIMPPEPPQVIVQEPDPQGIPIGALIAICAIVLVAGVAIAALIVSAGS